MRKAKRLKKSILLATFSSGVLVFGLLPGTIAQASSNNGNSTPTATGFQTGTFAQGNSSLNNPDDITKLGDNTFVTFQNGVGAKGEANSTGSTTSTIVEYDRNGGIVNQWSLTGKCDGLTADPANNRVLATVNEDGNSSMYIIYPNAPQSQQLQHITYTGSLVDSKGNLQWGGGTDSIAVQNGNIYLSASAPADSTHSALVQAVINGNTANLIPVMPGNATATDAVSGASVTLGLTDPDSSTVVPANAPQYAGDIALDSQGNSQIIFVHHPGASDQSQQVLKLTNGVQIDDMAWATSTQGTLYVTDSVYNTVYGVTGNFTPGTLFVSVPKTDAGVPGYVGILDTATGNVQPFLTGMGSSKGLMFVPAGSTPELSGFQVSPFAQKPASTSSLDDITKLGDNTFVTFQNGVGAKGEANSTGGTTSTIVEYDRNGQIVNQWSLTGKCDGLTADPANNRVLATVNEDGNSSMYLISPDAPQSQKLQHITYTGSLVDASGNLQWGGGTDSIAVQDGNIYLSASAPADSTHSALVQAVINGNTAQLIPVMEGNATAKDAVSGASVTLGLTDPDSSTVVPANAPQYAGDIALDSQGDSQIIFVHHPGASDQSQQVLNLTNKTQIDDMAWSTSAQGTLYVADSVSNSVYAVTGNFTPGTLFVAVPKTDAGVPGYVGILDTATGNVQPFLTGMGSPKGLMFVPSSTDSGSTGTKTFSDIKGHWAQADIEKMAAHLVVKGETDTTFAPDAYITRAEFSTLIVRALGLSDRTGTNNFKDVQLTDWFEKDVSEAASLGLVKGYEDGTFQPNQNITREVMAIMVARAMEFVKKQIDTNGSLSQFKDGSMADGWANSSLVACVNAGIIKGDENGNIRFNENATRAEGTVMLERLMQYLQFLN